MTKGRHLIDQINRNAAFTSQQYVTTDLGIRESNEETANIISSTFGVIKNSFDALWYAVGLDPNVNSAYQKTLMNPDASFEAMGRRYYPHPGVGTIRAYTEAGNPAGGCFSMTTLA